MDTLAEFAGPGELAAAARDTGCASVAFTYNDPVIFLEYAVDVARACREVGVRAVAVTAGYIDPAPRADFFAAMDAANVDLKAFSERFYHKVCGGHLEPVLETLEYIHRETDTWLEITTLLIPGENDSQAEVEALCSWVAQHLGPDVPLHFTAFHPDWKLRDVQRTPAATLHRARQTAQRAGLRHVYTGNVRDTAGGSTWCHGCGALLIERDWHRLGHWGLDGQGACLVCGSSLPGVFDGTPRQLVAQPLRVRFD